MALEYLQIAELVAREKDIDKEQVIEVMEQAIQMAARKKLAAELGLQPLELTVQAHIDRVTGDVAIKRLVKVVPPARKKPARQCAKAASPTCARPATSAATPSKAAPTKCCWRKPKKKTPPLNWANT
jgi:hypothetical protein